MTATQEPPIDLRTEPSTGKEDQPIPVTRRRVDHLLMGLGAVMTVVMLAAGGLLLWGAEFAQNYVHDQLAAQDITFGSKDSLDAEGRGDLDTFAGQQVTTGKQAEAYASYIAGHIAKASGGKTYSELGGPQRAAVQAVADAKARGASDSDVTSLQNTATQLTQQRDTVFEGEMLRGTLLNAYAWATVGLIAEIAAVVAFVGAAVMAVFLLLGYVHLRRMRHAAV
jgi:hypothetical protein